MLTDMGKKARQAAQSLARAGTEQKNAALTALAEHLLAQSDMILAANARDVADSQKARLAPAILDRLTLNPARLQGIVSELRQTIALPDPVRETFEQTTLPNGLKIHKQRVPLGVIGVIYEARPNVTVDVAGLALKSGNAVILRGGSETLRTNQALVTVIRSTLEEHALPADAVQFIDSPDRALVLELLKLHEYVDIIIPRGGAGLHSFCRENSRIPVITGGVGICHIFVDASADLQAALPVIHNAKTQRPSVCNALDTLLVHYAIAADFLPRVVEYLGKDGVTFRADPAALECLRAGADGKLPASVQPAGSEDFDTEWMSLVLGLKVVASLEEAIRHTNAHSLGHSDSILTADPGNALTWVNEVDSAAVYVNASTRFTDGNQFGLGAEVAISTQRLHARGPMGLRELTTYKWVVVGEYHVRP
ncbi:MAG: glutamate-5-semialdehyde dehydrogenase [Anaerolineales bacterium]